MKKLLVFHGYDSYPSGGWNDFRGSFDTETEALRFLVLESFDWCHIIDAETGVRIFESKAK